MRGLCCQCVWQCVSFALKCASRVFERAGKICSKKFLFFSDCDIKHCISSSSYNLYNDASWSQPHGHGNGRWSSVTAATPVSHCAIFIYISWLLLYCKSPSSEVKMFLARNDLGTPSLALAVPKTLSFFILFFLKLLLLTNCLTRFYESLQMLCSKWKIIACVRCRGAGPCDWFSCIAPGNQTPL